MTIIQKGFAGQVKYVLLQERKRVKTEAVNRFHNNVIYVIHAFIITYTVYQKKMEFTNVNEHVALYINCRTYFRN